MHLDAPNLRQGGQKRLFSRPFESGLKLQSYCGLGCARPGMAWSILGNREIVTLYICHTLLVIFEALSAAQLVCACMIA